MPRLLAVLLVALLSLPLLSELVVSQFPDTTPPVLLGISMTPTPPNKCVPLAYNGDPKDKLDVVFVPVNFKGDMATFKAFVDTVVHEGFYEIEPFASQKDKINFYYIDSDELSGDFDTVMTDPTFRNSIKNLASNCPKYDKMVVFWKGAKGRGYAHGLDTADVGYDPAEEKITVIKRTLHEFGHLFELADEYTQTRTESEYWIRAEPNIDFLNTTTACPKWCQGPPNYSIINACSKYKTEQDCSGYKNIGTSDEKVLCWWGEGTLIGPCYPSPFTNLGTMCRGGTGCFLSRYNAGAPCKECIMGSQREFDYGVISTEALMEKLKPYSAVLTVEKVDETAPELLGISMTPTPPKTKCVPLAYNGDPKDKLDVVFVPVNFKGDMDKFRTFVTDAMNNGFYKTEPFASEKSRINFYYVDSDEWDFSGSLDSGLTPEFQKAAKEIASVCPHDNIMVIGNPDKSIALMPVAGRDIAFTYSATFVYYVLHEFGHSFGGLADGYFEDHKAGGALQFYPDIDVLNSTMACPKWCHGPPNRTIIDICSKYTTESDCNGIKGVAGSLQTLCKWLGKDASTKCFPSFINLGTDCDPQTGCFLSRLDAGTPCLWDCIMSYGKSDYGVIAKVVLMEKLKSYSAVASPVSEVKKGTAFSINTDWEDDTSIKNATLFICHGPEGRCGSFAARPLEIQPIFSGTFTHADFSINTNDFTEGETVTYYLQVCDSATKYGSNADRCSKTQTYSFSIIDDIPPVIGKAEMAGTPASDSKPVFTATGLSDPNGLGRVALVINGTEVRSKGIYGNTEVDSVVFDDYIILRGFEGRTVDWAIRVYDNVGNAGEKGGSFSVPDKTPPTLQMVLDKSTVRVGENLKLTLRAKDNYMLKEAVLYVNKAKVKTWDFSKDEGGLPGSTYEDVFTIVATQPQFQKTVEVKLVVMDMAGNSVEKNASYWVNAPECADKTSPTVVTNIQAPATARPGDKVTITAKFADSVDQYGCGGLDYAHLEVAGEDGAFKLAGLAFLKTAADAQKGAQGKVTSATASFDYTVPDYSKPQFVVTGIVLPAGITRGLGGSLGGFGGPLPITGAATANANHDIIYDMIAAIVDLFNPTGRQVQPPASSVPLGTAGTQMKWRIAAFDENGNRMFTGDKVLSVVDEVAPVQAGGVGAWNKVSQLELTAGETENVTTDSMELPVKLVQTAAGGKQAVIEVNGTRSPLMINNELMVYGGLGFQYLTGTQGTAGASDTAVVDILKPFARAQKDDEIVFAGCWQDWGILTRLELQADQGAGFARVAVGAFGSSNPSVESAPAGQKVCRFWTWKPEEVAPGAQVTWRIEAADKIGNKNQTEARTFVVGSKPPVLVGKNWEPLNPVVGQKVVISAQLEDDNGLASASIESDETGKFMEKDFVSLNGTSETTMLMWRAPEVAAGTVINWRLVATDVDGNRVVLDPAFTIQPDTTPPTIIAWADTEVLVGSNVTITATVSDDALLKSVLLEVDEGQGYVVKETRQMDLSEAPMEFKWSNPDLPAGTRVKWRIRATDISGNEAVSPEYSFVIKTLEEAAPIPGGCDTAKRPQDVTGPCVEVGSGIGQQTVTTYSCDTVTGEWKPSIMQQPCAPAAPPAALPVTFIVVGAIALAVVGGATYYIFKVRRPAAPAPTA